MLLATFPLSAILLGLINIVIVVVVLLLVGAIIQWILSIIGFAPPEIVVKLFLVIVALVALYMIVGLLFGVVPVPHIIGMASALRLG
jgi:hypothetical protein